MRRRDRVTHGLGVVLLPLSIVPLVSVGGDVIRGPATAVGAGARSVPAAAPGPALPHRAPAPPLDAPVRPSIALAQGASLTLGTKDGRILLELDRRATAEGRRLLVDADRDGAADVTVRAGLGGVTIFACQTSTAALAASGSARRGDGGTTVHLPAHSLGAAPRFAVARGGAGDATCRGASFTHRPSIALPGGPA